MTYALLYYDLDTMQFEYLPGYGYGLHSHRPTIDPSVIPNIEAYNTLQIRVDYTADPYDEEVSDVLSLDVVRCAPELDENASPNPEVFYPKCFGSTDGGFKITFDRQLQDDEKMLLTVFPWDDNLKKFSGFPEVYEDDVIGDQDHFLDRTLIAFENAGLASGKYRIRWTTGPIQANAFEVVGGGEVDIELFDPEAINFNLITTDITCEGGSDGEIQISNLTGGTGSYTFDWFMDGNPFNPPQGSTDTHLVNLPIGQYSVIITDENDCESDEGNVELQVLGTNPKLNSFLIFQPGEPPGHLPTGSIVLADISGGDGDYAFHWSKNGIPFLPNDAINLQELQPGEYTLTIVDNNGMGCSSEEYVFTIIELPPLEVTITETQSIICEGDLGQIIAEVTGGTGGNYLYEWSTGETNQTIVVGPGTYTVTVTDNGNNEAMDSYEIEYQNPLLLTHVIQNNTLCKGENLGSIQLNISGGTGGPYTVNWLDSPSTEVFRENLPPGEYVYFVSDGNCQITNEDNPIILTEPDLGIEVIPVSAFDASVNGATDGGLTVSVENAVVPINYLWTKDGIPFEPPLGPTNDQLVGLGAGEYNVTVIDANGCSAFLEEPIIITEPEPMSIVGLISIDVGCKGEASGSISASVTGTAPFNYVWSKEGEESFSAPNQPTITGLAAGTYILRLNDASGAPEVLKAIVVNEPTEFLGASLTPFPTECFIGDEGMLQINAYGGTPPYKFSMDKGLTFQEESTFFNLSGGDYEILILDSNNCELQTGATVGLPSQSKPEFAMASQVFVDDTVVIVDLSHPIPDETEWTLPESALLLRKDNDEIQIRFMESGEYEIGLAVIRDNCRSQKTKKILVLEKDGLLGAQMQDTGAQNWIEEFIVYPNPTFGRFNTSISLGSPGNINLSIFGFANNNLIFQTQLGGKDYYDVPMNIEGLPSGIYVVVLQTQYGNALRKLILR